MPTFKVWIAAETLLYMPVYALGDLGILDRVAISAGIKEGAKIEVRTSPGKGDRGAIEHMLNQADVSANEIHIAICDPIRAVQADPDGKRVSILGALIKRPPLWEVGRDGPDGSKLKEHKYVYYDETWATGNFLGRLAADADDTDDREPCKYGEEFDDMVAEERLGFHRVVTADVRTMVEWLQRDPKIQIQKHFAKEPELRHFVTTSIITHKKYAKDDAKALSLFMEALRSACILLRTAQAPTRTLIEQIMARELTNGASPDADSAGPGVTVEETARRITELIFEDEIYADSLSLKYSEWQGALKPRGFGSQQRRKAAAYFFKVYDPHPSRDMTAEWLIKAIKDYGRFANEARRLRGASIMSLISILVFVMHALAVDLYAPGIVGPENPILHWTAIASVLFGSAILASIMLALLRENLNLILPLQRMFAIDDELATSLSLALVTIPALTILFLVAKFAFGIEFDTSSIISAAAGFVAVLTVYGLKLWQRRDA